MEGLRTITNKYIQAVNESAIEVCNGDEIKIAESNDIANHINLLFLMLQKEINGILDKSLDK